MDNWISVMSRDKKLDFVFLLFIVLNGKLVPILNVPCINNFLFWYYFLFVPETKFLGPNG
jgi:hypothetical protein